MGHVYFIRHKKFSPVKIGHTKDYDVMKRVNSFNTSSPFGIEFLGSIKSYNPELIEKEIHNELKEFRLNGEWFDIDVDYVSIIIGRYPNKKFNEKRRISQDIPYKFDYEKYDLDELKIFRQFFYKFYLNQKFDYELIEKCVMEAINKEVQIKSAKNLFSKWKGITTLKNRQR